MQTLKNGFILRRLLDVDDSPVVFDILFTKNGISRYSFDVFYDEKSGREALKAIEESTVDSQQWDLYTHHDQAARLWVAVCEK